MRPLAVLPIILLFAMLAAVPGATGQPAGSYTTLFTDPSGDVGPDPAAPGVPQDLSNADLASLSVRETPAGFWIRVQFHSFDATTEEVRTTSSEADVAFRFEGTEYLLRLRRPDASVTYYSASLRFAVDGVVVWYMDSWTSERVIASERETWIEAFLSRADLARTRPAPARGDEIVFTGVAGAAYRVVDPYGNAQMRTTDRMPDRDEEATWVVQQGVLDEGAAVLRSASEPFRASNGGAGSALFTLQLENLGASTEQYAVRAVDASEGLGVMLPVTSLELEPGKRVQIPAILETRSGHAHGGHDVVAVEAAALSGSGVGRVLIGIEYLHTPQPAGHHDTLFFHGREVSRGLSQQLMEGTVGQQTRSAAYMNADAADHRDTGADLPAINVDPATQPGRTRYTWWIELDPRISLGLDFLTEASGALDAVLASSLPFEAELSGRLLRLLDEEDATQPYYLQRRTVEILGTLQPQAVSITSGGTTAVAAPMHIAEGADRVRYASGSNLGLELTLDVAGARHDTGSLSPRIRPGGSLVLPLAEYRDAIDSLFAAGSGLTLDVDGLSMRRAHAGATLLVPLTIAAPAGVEAVTVAAMGEALDVRFPDGDRIAVPGPGPARATAVVHVPADASPAQVRDVFFQASPDDGGHPALAQFTVVVTDAEAGDDAAAAARLGAVEEGAPALSFWTAALVLAALAARRHR